MSVDSIMSGLKETIASLQLSEEAAQALFLLAQDPHGIEKEAGPSIVASSHDISMEKANQAIIELLEKRLLTLDTQHGRVRYFANYESLNFDAEAIELLHSEENAIR